jgi:hypothetical protein
MTFLSIPCPKCKAECLIQPDFNFVQMCHCERCGCLFQFTFAVRQISKSSGGEVRTGEWRVLAAPTIESVQPNGNIIFRYGDEDEHG